MKRKNVNLLFFIECGCGNIKYLSDELFAIKKVLGYKITAGVSTMDIESGITEYIQNAGIPTLIFEGMECHKNFWKHLFFLRNFFKTNLIDVVHVQTNWELVMCFFASLFLHNKPKILYTIHAFRNNEGIFKRNMAKALMIFSLYIMADKVIATCEFVYSHFKILGKKISVINLGIDELYIKHLYAVNDDNLSLIFPAIFREGKRQDLLIKAFKRYRDEAFDDRALLILPGTGDYVDKCKMLAFELGISDFVLFPGMCAKEDLLQYYNLANVLVCPSISETYCQSIVEGFSLGKCILTTPVGISPEIIKPGINGFFFNTEDELVVLLKNISNNRSLLAKISHNNYVSGRRFSWNNIVSEYDKVISDF